MLTLARFMFFIIPKNIKMRFLLTIFLLTSTIAFGQDAKADGILDNLSEEIKKMNSFYIEFSANIKNNITGTDENETGKGWVKNDKYYASYGDITVLSNGMKTWTIVKEEKSVYEVDADEEDEETMNPKKLMTIWETGFKSKYVGEVKLSGETTHKINLFPKNPGSVEYHTITLYVTKSSGDLKKVTMKTKDATTMSYTISKFQPNPSIPDSKFIYDKKKYPGYVLIRD